MFKRVSCWVSGKQFRYKMVVSMIGFKGENTIELGDYQTAEEARKQGDIAMKNLLAKMPKITVVERVILENLLTGEEVLISWPSI